MTTTIISTTRAPAPGGAYSQAVAAGGFVFCAGQVGVDPQTGEIRAGLEAQTAQALENLRAVVEEADGTLDDVCKTTCFLADIGDFAVFNSVYAAVFGERLPARSTFGVALAPGLLVEIEAVVFVGRG